MRIHLLLLALLALALPVDAYYDGCVARTAWAEIDTAYAPITYHPLPDAGVGRYYVDNVPDQMDGWSVWIYQESNSIDGLQRQDELQDDTCGIIPGDTLIF